MLILGVDTSAMQSSVAVLSGGKIILENWFGEAHRPSRHLLPMIKNTLDESKVPLAEIDIFAAAQGPGSFTGIRIGLGAMMGLADSLDKPVYGFDSLECAAMAMGDWGECMLAPTGKARAGYFYTALFRYQDGPKRLTQDMEVTPQNLAEFITGPVIFTGDGLVGKETEIRDCTSHDIEFIHSTTRSAAAGAAMLAAEISQTEHPGDNPPTPKYVGRSQAEINYETNRSLIRNKGGNDGR